MRKTGSRVNFDFVVAFIKEHFERVQVRGYKINCRCRFCGDSKKSKRKARFNVTYYNDEKIIYHCFNCEESGNFLKLYSKIKNISLEQARIELGLSAFSSIKDHITKEEPKEEPQPIKLHNYILDDCISDDDNGAIARILKNALKEFRESRQIPESMRLYIAYKGRYAKRIIVPVFDENDNIIYFQGRSLLPNPERKYLNPSTEKSIIIPKFHKLESPVVITEGLIDSEMLGNHGTSCLGKSVSEEMIEKLRDKKIIVAIDNDPAGYESLRDFLKYNKYSGIVKYFLMPEKYKEVKDLNELKIKYPDINILEFVLDNSHSKLQTITLLKFDVWRV